MVQHYNTFDEWVRGQLKQGLLGKVWFDDATNLYYIDVGFCSVALSDIWKGFNDKAIIIKVKVQGENDD